MPRQTMRLKALTHKSQLSVLQQKYVLSDVCKVIYDPETEVSLAACMQFWFAELLHAMCWLPLDQQQLVISQSYHELGIEFNKVLKENPNLNLVPSKPDPIVQVVFMDTKYALWTGHEGLLELATGEPFSKLTSPPVESVAYNLVELVRRELHRCRPIEHELGL